MKVKKRIVGDVVILDLSGEIKGGPDQTVFKGEIKDVVDEGHKRVLINLAKVGWVNSTGLGILMTGFATVLKAEGDLRFLNVGNRIKSLFVITHLKMIFKTYDSEEEALASFNDE